MVLERPTTVQSLNTHIMAEVIKKSDKKYLPFHIRKELQNLKSWKALYTYLGTTNTTGAAQVDQQISEIESKYC